MGRTAYTEPQCLYKGALYLCFKKGNMTLLQLSFNTSADTLKTQIGVSVLCSNQYCHTVIYYSKSALHVLGNVFAHHQENLTVFTVSGSVHPSCCRLVPRSRPVSRTGDQPTATWVNPTRYCKYRQVLLMIGENIARNMYCQLGIIN
jgi:hypothetical protein